jgi:hypothetical protein
MAFVAAYDANVLYPAALRDLLVRLAQTGLFQAKWTEQILDETFEAIVRTQPELADRVERTRRLSCVRRASRRWPGRDRLRSTGQRGL